jgi:peptide chain release factor 1
MFDKLKDIEAKYVEVEKSLSDPTQISNPQRLQSLAKTHAELAPIVSTFKEYQKVQLETDEVLSLLEEDTEEDLLELAKGELESLTQQKEQLEKQLQLLMLPKDSNDERNVITEIRAGTGGEEASLFAAELFRMYSRYAERQGWKIEILSANETGLKGFKED